MDFSRALFYVAGIFVRLCSCDISADYPPSPSFTVIPSQPSYDNGHKITMICTPPNNSDAKGICYFKNFTERHCDEKMETMNHYTIIESKKEDEGVYNCGYWVISNGSEKLSYGSNIVNIMIADTTASWTYYTAGGIVFFAVYFISCLLYKRTQKRKSSNKISGRNLTYYNPRHRRSKEPLTSFPVSPEGQNHPNNPLYSVICQNPTPVNKQLLSGEANTKMTTDSKGFVLESFKMSVASAEDFSQVQEEAHIYSEIGTEISPNISNYQHPSTNTKSSSPGENAPVYYTAQVPPLSSSSKSSSPGENAPVYYTAQVPPLSSSSKSSLTEPPN